jgi:heme/copper-type cytochrome/quinol oxidase subunit 2
MENELPDTAEAMEARETAQAVPAGWLVLFFGLIAWGVYYLYMYSPWSTGWTQAGELEKVNPEVGGNIGMTILFTALPTAAALVLFLLQRKKRA